MQVLMREMQNINQHRKIKRMPSGDVLFGLHYTYYTFSIKPPMIFLFPDNTILCNFRLNLDCKKILRCRVNVLMRFLVPFKQTMFMKDPPESDPRNRFAKVSTRPKNALEL